MRYTTIAMLLCAVLAGCASRTGPSYGNFLQGAPDLATSRFVGDTLQQLSSIHPPARTQLNLQQEASDPFGARLVEALRGKGYAVLEFKPGTVSLARQPGATFAESGVSLRYVLDRPGNAELYRLAVFVGDRTLTRAYLAQSNTAVPAGAWLRKE